MSYPDTTISHVTFQFALRSVHCGEVWWPIPLTTNLLVQENLVSTIQFTHHHNDKSFTLTDPPPGRPAWSGVAPEVLWPPLVSPLTDTRQDWRTPRVLMINIGHKLTRRETGGNKRNWPSLTYPLFLDHSIYHPILRASDRGIFGGLLMNALCLGGDYKVWGAGCGR